MYIISKRKDYFDYLTQIYGIDKAVVYHRKPNELGDGGANGEEFDYSNEKFSRKIIVTRIDLWFCDEHYPTIQVECSVSGIGISMFTELLYYYSYSEFESAWNSVVNKSNWWKEDLKKYLSTKSNSKINKKHASPQLLMIGKKIFTDIILKDYDFQRIVPAEQAYQRVSMWMNSRPDVPQTVPTDMHRFEAKGFDKKTSFRKM